MSSMRNSQTKITHVNDFFAEYMKLDESRYESKLKHHYFHLVVNSWGIFQGIYIYMFVGSFDNEHAESMFGVPYTEGIPGNYWKSSK